MIVRIPFNHNFEPGTYQYGMRGSMVYAIFTCPYCSTRFNVGDRSHIIGLDGYVHPEVTCATTGCFREFIQFDGFDGTVLDSGGARGK